MSAASPPRNQLPAPALDRVAAELVEFTRGPLTRAEESNCLHPNPVVPAEHAPDSDPGAGTQVVSKPEGP